MLLSVALLGIVLQLDTAFGQLKVPKERNVLTPPYFNIATGKKIESTATCGQSSSQIYCKLTGGPNEYRYNENLHQGHFCEVCDANELSKSHPINYAIDGTEKWWQSPPLSEGTEYNKINITLNLGQVFHVAYVIIKFANSPRAGTWVLERSSDHGKTFHPWQYFANSDSDCHNLFGIDAHEVITSDDSVVCTAEYSDAVPLERGEVIVSTINRRPGAKNFSHSPVLQEWTRATNIRLRLLRTKTLLGHLMAVQRQDPTVTRRYYYSIKDISVGGRCVCNGHADTCIPDPHDKYKLKCQCRHNTCGDSCEYCCRDFVQKVWKAAVPESSNECEPCNCHGHGEYCVYDEQVAIRRLSLDIYGNYEGGGVCQNCTHDTTGINCEKCADGFYRPANVDPRDPNGCKPCDCDSAFTVGTCEPVTGRCYCQSKYAGDRCDSCAPGYHDFPECEECPCFFNATRNGVCEPQNDTCPCMYNFAGMYCNGCAPGFYNFPECKACTCNGDGAMNQYCDQRTGQCVCDQGFGGMYCDQCSAGYFNYPLCQPCSCQTAFTTAEVCDMNTGVCFCTDFITGESCNQCIPEYYDFPQCKECECASIGSTSNLCHHESGKCDCLENYQGTKCDECAPGFYDYPNCIPCSCNTQGSFRTNCDVVTGQCACYRYISGRQCDQCSPEYFNFPRCEDCKCDPRGIKEFIPGVCLAFTVGYCDCRENVVGKYCDRCSPLHYDMSLGCIDCNCFLPGTLDGVAPCDSKSGTCWCKSYTSTKQCSQCEEGFFGLEEKNYFGCYGCQCNAGGAVSEDCDTVTGKCRCKRGVTGRQCNQVEANFYIPSFLQYKYEAEFAKVTEEEILRFGFDPERFPGYSMKGYSEFSNVQDEIIIPIHVESNGLYKILFYYVQHGEPSTANVVVYPVTAVGSEQTFEAVFEVKMEPTLMTSDAVLVLNEGEWNIIIRGKPGLLIDYLIVLPSQYYEPVILQAKINEPCKSGSKSMNKECLMYTHPSLDHIPGRPLSDFAGPERYASPSSSHPQMVLLDGNSLDESRRNLSAKLIPNETGKYVVVLEYASDREEMQTIEAVITDDRLDIDVIFNVYACEYAFLCRQVALTSLGDIAVFDITLPTIQVDMSVDAGEVVYVSSIHAIPYEEWTMEYVEPKRRCITKQETGFNNCISWVYPTPVASRKFEVGRGGDTSGINPPTATSSEIDVKYITDNTTVQIEMDLEPGRYLFLLHYYNPQHLSFWPSVVISGGITHEGLVNVTYCPSGDGCRGVVTANTGEVVLDITSPMQTMTITVPKGKSFWLDYVLAIPENSYSMEALDLMKFDHTREFFEECFVVGGKGLIELAENPSEFCRLAVFSLTTDFNDGALACNCSDEGTVDGSDITCEEYGGRCLCKPNVIGRSCDKCAIGHYGYPDCKPCDCNTTLCDEDTGDCICPPNTVVPECDHCVPFTHTYHPLAGCVACDCNKEGVEDAADLGCSEQNGQCRCRDNVEGHRCDRCMPGYFGFPECRPCVCDQRGRISEGCDPVSGQCLCKEHVEGQQCDRCKSGSFYLDGNNPLGCTKCFCFGVSTDCSSTMYPATEITEMDGWRLINLKTETPDLRFEDRSVAVDIIENGGAINPYRAELYWAAPNPYLYNQIGSYGGVLRYTVHSGKRETHNNSVESNIYDLVKPAPLLVASPNVILKGNGMVIATKIHQKSGKSMVTFTESNFLHQTTAPVTREEMMMVLDNLESLHILASDDPEAEVASISEVSLSTTNYKAQLGSGPTIRTVEECICPKGYTGDSCQICSRGHYRQDLGPFLGYCAECDCYGHCDQCDKSGNLIDKNDCLHNTAGDHCEQCKEGYIGVAKSRDPDACQICPCPHPTATGNFAKSCEYDEADELICYCENGYTGARCELCDVGYFGNPIVIGGKCQTCDCNGNLDVDASMETCNTFTGECMDCKFNTAGKFCERCADGYFGDAVHAHNCTECSCLACGTSKCDYKTGQCTCRPHVTGNNCDQCELGFFNLDSCNGCQDCACAIGSKDTICDTMTGQCVCAPSVVGLKCDKCAQGHWDYSSIGCKPCNCHNHGDCNPATGECYCPPGITGPHCDQCELKRYIIPPHGSECEPCDVCTHALLDVIEPLTNDAQMTSEELSKITVGVVAARKFEQLYSKTEEAKNVVDDLQKHEDDINVDVKSLLKPDVVFENEDFSGSGEFESSGEFGPIVFKKSEPDSYTSAMITLNKVEALVSKMCNQTETLLENFEKTFSISLRLEAATFPLNDEVRTLESTSLEALEEMNSESSGDLEEYNQKMNQAEMLLERMKTRNFEPMKDTADPELTLALQLFEYVKNNFSSPATYMENRVGILSGSIEDKLVKMREFRNLLSDGIKTVTDVSAMNDANSKAISKAKEVITRVKVTWEEIRQHFEDAQNHADQVGRNRSEVIVDDALAEAISELQFARDNLTERLDGKEELLNKSLEKSNMLDEDAKTLVRIDNETKTDPRNMRVIDATNRYSTIVNAMEEAKEAANGADLDATEARDEVLEENLDDVAKNASEYSGTLLNEVHGLRTKQLSGLENDLEAATGASDGVTLYVNSLTERHDALKQRVAALDTGGIDGPSQNAKSAAADAQELADDVMNTARSLQDKIDQAPDPNIPLQSELNTIKKIFNSFPDKMRRADNKIDNLRQKLARVSKLSNDLDLDDKMQKIRKLIELSRSRADTVKVSMKYEKKDGRETPEYTQLRIPPYAANFDDFIKIELLVNVSTSNNSIMYLGDVSSKDGDYMSLATKGGKVVYNYKVGTGEGEIVSNIQIDDGKWHRITMQRLGNQGNLGVEYIATNVTGDVFGGEVKRVDGQQGTTSTDNIKAHMPFESTALLVGGNPIVSLPDKVNNRHMSGCIQNVKVNGEDIGLWNFVSYNGPQPAQTCRNTVPDVSTTTYTRMWKFRGTDSYLRISKRQLKQENFVINSATQNFIIRFKFSTTQSNALIFFVGHSVDQFFAIELRNGKFVITCNFGWEEPKQGTSKTFPDVNTRSQSLAVKAGVVTTSRNKIIVLAINAGLILSINFNEWAPKFDSDAWVGGIHRYNKIEELRPHVTTMDDNFRGCLGQLGLTFRSTFSIYNAYERVGVTQGCEEEMITSIKVNGDEYITVASELPNARVVTGLVTIRSDNAEGTIIHAEETENVHNLTLFMRNGHVVLSDGTWEVTSEERYNDGQRHTIKFERYEDGALYLNVDNDDVQTVEGEATEQPTRRRKRRINRPTKESAAKISLFANAPVHIYVGGTADLQNFVGCISNIRIEGDSNHPGLLTEGARCGNTGNIKCSGKPQFNKCSTMNTGESAVVSVSPAAKSERMEEGEISAHDFTMGRMTTTKDGDSDEDSMAVVEKEGNKKKNGGRKRNRNKSGNRSQTILGIDAARSFNSAYDGNCQLPLEPETSGFFYPGDGYSRYSVDDFNSMNWRFALRMRTVKKEGIIFFMCTTGCPEHIAVYLIKGKVTLSVKFGDSRRRIKPNRRFNDGYWHDITFQRKGENLQMIIDDTITNVEFTELSHTFSTLMLFYVGGLQAMEKRDAEQFMSPMHLSDFHGCIQSLVVNDQAIETSSQSRLHYKMNLRPCFEGETEEGIFFPNTDPSDDGEYMMVYNIFNVGINLEVTMEIRPRTQSGVMLAVGGYTGNFFQLLLVDGKVVATMRQGSDRLMSVYDPTDFGHTMCDGNWHKVNVTKSKNILILNVDGNQVQPVVRGNINIRNCITDGPLYIGGIPRDARVGRPLADRRQYTGCMRKIKVDYFNITTSIAIEVKSGVSKALCPLESTP